VYFGVFLSAGRSKTDRLERDMSKFFFFSFSNGGQVVHMRSCLLFSVARIMVEAESEAWLRKAFENMKRDILLATKE
jgi:hypothetical protein